MSATIAARLDRLPVTRTILKMVTLISLGGFFEFYDIFLTAYMAPGLYKSGIFSPVSSIVATVISGFGPRTNSLSLEEINRVVKPRMDTNEHEWRA